MLINSNSAENAAVLQTAQAMAAAARTAPKTKGVDHMHTLIVTGEELGTLADEMHRLADEIGFGFFHRDAECVRKAGAVLLIGVENASYGLAEGCRYCHYENCADMAAHDGACVYPSIDLGIAIGSAVSVAADNRVDCRVMFSVGKGALALGWMGEGVTMAMGIPLSVSGKSPFFDRKSTAPAR